MGRVGHDLPGRAAGSEAPGGGMAASGAAAGGVAAGGSTRDGRGRVAARHLGLLACYLAAGIAVTWPRVTYLAGRLPATRDAGGYVWDFWWVARQVTHLASPWSTSYIAAPAGSDLGYHTLMPLPAVLLAPLTLASGPSASYNLLSIACPGLLCYVMYRAARLWLPAQAGAIAAGALFGLSSILAWRSWYEINLAAGALFLPMALEASVRLRRRPGRRQAIILGLVMGAAVLTDQESAVLAAIVTALVLLPWMLRHPAPARLWPPAIATAVGTVIATPQITAMIQQALAGGASAPLSYLASNYVNSGAGLGQMFSPSPRIGHLGLRALGSVYYRQGPANQVVVTFGVVLTILAVFGLAVSWRRRSARLLGLLWAGCAALALGSAIWIGTSPRVPVPDLWHGVYLSQVLPFTWFVKIPGLSSFREADRFTLLGLIPATLLAGAAVNWLRYHARPLLIPVLALALLEAGWSGNPAIATMPTAMPALDGPIAADHTHSIVIDIPFGIRGGLPVIGSAFPPQSMVLATADHHPLADAFISRIPAITLSAIQHHPFYAALLNAEGGHARTTPAERRAAWADARRMNVGWVLLWQPTRHVLYFLRQAGLRFRYRVDGVSVYRPTRPKSLFQNPRPARVPPRPGWPAPRSDRGFETGSKHRA
jgi:hypothetical protein